MYLTVKDQYLKGEEVSVKITNKGSNSISYQSECSPSFVIEKYTDDHFEPININDPCTGCIAMEMKKTILPGEQTFIGDWDQKTYNKECYGSDNYKLASSGLYKVIFRYYNSKGASKKVSRKFMIGKYLECKPICKHEGTRSEGWYDSCTEELIKYDDCNEEEIRPQRSLCLKKKVIAWLKTRVRNRSVHKSTLYYPLIIADTRILQCYLLSWQYSCSIFSAIERLHERKDRAFEKASLASKEDRPHTRDPRGEVRTQQACPQYGMQECALSESIRVLSQ